jgi:hypothetical protein
MSNAAQLRLSGIFFDGVVFWSSAPHAGSAVLICLRIQARLIMLYRSMHNLRRSGSSVQYLSHSSSLRNWP